MCLAWSKAFHTWQLSLAIHVCAISWVDHRGTHSGLEQWLWASNRTGLARLHGKLQSVTWLLELLCNCLSRKKKSYHFLRTVSSFIFYLSWIRAAISFLLPFRFPLPLSLEVCIFTSEFLVALSLNGSFVKIWISLGNLARVSVSSKRGAFPSLLLFYL